MKTLSLPQYVSRRIFKQILVLMLTHSPPKTLLCVKTNLNYRNEGKRNDATFCVCCCIDPSDYNGGAFGVTFEMAASDTQCINIILVSDNEREESEDFFVHIDLDDMGPIRAGNPSRTTVRIEGMAKDLKHTS